MMQVIKELSPRLYAYGYNFNDFGCYSYGYLERYFCLGVRLRIIGYQHPLILLNFKYL